MQSFRFSRKFWIGWTLLVILVTAACSLDTTLRRFVFIFEKEKATDRDTTDFTHYLGPYHCREEHGQSFYSSLDMPTEPGLKMSLQYEDLQFIFNVLQDEVDLNWVPAYQFDYYCSSQTLTPIISYYDGKITNVEHELTNWTQKMKSPAEGRADAEGWFSGQWTERKQWEIPAKWEAYEAETNYAYIGVMDLQWESPRILICSWYQQPDLAAAKASGVEGFAEFCKDQNYIVCTRDVPD